jgi:adhesin HecA-like repeat protein
VGEVRITANGDLVNAGSINGGAVALSASDRLQNSGKVYAEGDLAVQAQFIENSSKTDNSNAVLAARGSASLTAGGSVTSSGLLAAGLQADGTLIDIVTVSVVAGVGRFVCRVNCACEYAT